MVHAVGPVRCTVERLGRCEGSPPGCQCCTVRHQQRFTNVCLVWSPAAMFNIVGLNNITHTISCLVGLLCTVSRGPLCRSLPAAHRSVSQHAVITAELLMAVTKPALQSTRGVEEPEFLPGGPAVGTAATRGWRRPRRTSAGITRTGPDSSGRAGCATAAAGQGISPISSSHHRQQGYRIHCTEQSPGLCVLL